ncbi:hypothetical protein ABIB90_007223 [Bradyrhizobium sp. JR4.1]
MDRAARISIRLKPLRPVSRTDRKTWHRPCRVRAVVLRKKMPEVST